MAAYLKVSAIKKLVKSKEKRCSKDFIADLDREVELIINRAIVNCETVTLKNLIKI